jgi:hypothetical protein
MKWAVAFLCLIAGASAKAVMHEMKAIKANSALGMKLLSQARKLANNNNNNNNAVDYSAATFNNTWVAGYSLKFEGCFHISQWNDEVDGENDVRIATKRLVRFRLCPSDYCDSSKGCSSGYGEYIIDMYTYLNAWFEAKQVYQSFQCSYLTNNVCQCSSDNSNYSEEKCLWDCYKAHNMGGKCMTTNPYGSSSDTKTFNLDDYMACGKLEGESSRRALSSSSSSSSSSNSSSYAGSYYVGPYCSQQGGAVYLGLFTDDTCTDYADSVGGRETYYDLMGTNLPYGQTNVVDMDCVSCKEPATNNNDGNDATDADNVTEVCEVVYEMAGKCETYLPYGTVLVPNNNACNYMAGIKVVRKDGTVISSASKANKTGSVFTGFFSVSFVLLSAYVYYLKTRLDRASINLAE